MKSSTITNKETNLPFKSSKFVNKLPYTFKLENRDFQLTHAFFEDKYEDEILVRSKRFEEKLENYILLPKIRESKINSSNINNILVEYRVQPKFPCKDVMDTAKDKMGKSCAVYQKEMVSLRAGRANPQLLDRIMVDYYGSPTPLNQIGNVSSPEARMLVISPWEAKMIGPIEKAIQKSDLGLNPTNDGKSIRLVIPPLTEERRKDLTKLIKKYGEEAKVAVRNVRRDVNDSLKKAEKAGEITEDDLKQDLDEIQKLTDKCMKDIDDILAKKDKELMEI